MNNEIQQLKDKYAELKAMFADIFKVKTNHPFEFKWKVIRYGNDYEKLFSVRKNGIFINDNLNRGNAHKLTRWYNFKYDFEKYDEKDKIQEIFMDNLTAGCSDDESKEKVKTALNYIFELIKIKSRENIDNKMKVNKDLVLYDYNKNNYDEEKGDVIKKEVTAETLRVLDNRVYVYYKEKVTNDDDNVDFNMDNELDGEKLIVAMEFKDEILELAKKNLIIANKELVKCIKTKEKFNEAISPYMTLLAL